MGAAAAASVCVRSLGLASVLELLADAVEAVLAASNVGAACADEAGVAGLSNANAASTSACNAVPRF